MTTDINIEKASVEQLKQLVEGLDQSQVEEFNRVTWDNTDDLFVIRNKLKKIFNQ